MLPPTYLPQGEIYNTAELKAKLPPGRVWRTKSDSEVLVHLWAEYGEGMLEMLDGEFAFALYDVQRRALLLARDPFGVK